MSTTVDGQPPDPLSLLRQNIATNSLPIPTTDADPSNQAESDVSLAQASYLIFNSQSPQDGAQHTAIPLTQSTRFVSAAAGGKPVDLRSVYFCWLNKDNTTAEYIAALQTLNAELQQSGKNETASNLVFAEKLDLVTWLAGDVSETESEYIRSLDDNKVARFEADEAAKQAGGGDDGVDVEMGDAGGLGDDAKKRQEEEIEHLREIYAAERKMGNHNTVLRGVKVHDFGAFRKYSGLFLGKSAKPTSASLPPQPQQPPLASSGPTTTLTNNPALRRPAKFTPSGRRPEPIILLSPSASSILRMPNIKSFLGDGVYQPITAGAESPSILHISRHLRGIWPGHATRFILVEDPSHFRPDYWNRVVAVFTTGQTWQFKNYKWTQPAELFSHALGVYVGWRGELVPDTVKGWGRGVLSVAIDKGDQRWRDREVVEDIWSQIETRMRALGWGKDGR